MLWAIFNGVLKMSLWATCMATIILAIKYFLQKAGCPKRIMFLLWGVIAVRLVCPIVPESNVSILNLTRLFEEDGYYEIEMNETVPLYTENAAEVKGMVVEAEESIAEKIIPCIWLMGAVIMIILSTADYLRLRRKLRFAIKVKNNIYTAEDIDTAFVFGIVRPKIYVPMGLGEKECRYATAHELTHIKRKDYIVKLLAYWILAVHWFNPFVWMMFVWFSDDMELVCDEETIIKLGNEEKESYVRALVEFAKMKNRRTLFYNVSFCTHQIKRRCIEVFAVKKAGRIVSFVSFAICGAVLLIFGTNAAEGKAVHYSEEVVEEYTEAYAEIYTEEKAQESVEETLMKKPEKQIEAEHIEKEPIVKSYSYREKLTSTTDNVVCDDEGNIYVGFEMNAPVFVWVKLYEVEKDELKESIGIIAESGKVHTFTGCDKGKSYRVKVESPLEDTWKIEGSYKIY